MKNLDSTINQLFYKNLFYKSTINLSELLGFITQIKSNEPEYPDAPCKEYLQYLHLPQKIGQMSSAMEHPGVISTHGLLDDHTIT